MVYGSLADILFQWDRLGVFDFMLPMLLVFAIVYGILASTKFFGGNKGVHIIIAVAIALMSLRYQFFLSSFLSELFPRLGIGLSIILAILILVGMFIDLDETRYWGYGLAALGAIIGIIIVFQSFDRLGYGFFNSYLGTDFVGYIVLGVLLIGVIIAVAASGGGKPRGGRGNLLGRDN